jgi:hypothetical protein
MTNWEGIPFSYYTALNTLAANINLAFHGASFDYDAATWAAGSLGTNVSLPGVATVYEVAFLSPASSIVPRREVPPTVDEVVPTVYALYQNYPNPFNPTTTIRFDLPMSSVVTVKIYNMIGQEVATVFDREEMTEGVQEVDFSAAHLASGVYFYHVVAEGTNADGLANGQTFTKVMKMALIK